MNFRSQLQGTGIGILICALALSATFIMTVMSYPFWRWFEAATGVESFGHSGSAEWCYWLVYGVLILSAALVWLSVRRQGGSATK